MFTRARSKKISHPGKTSIDIQVMSINLTAEIRFHYEPFNYHLQQHLTYASVKLTSEKSLQF